MGTSKSVLTRSQKVAFIGIFSALLIIARALRIPFRVPGLGGLPWLVILLIASLIVSEKFVGTKISIIGGIVASFFFDMPPGGFQIIKYVSAGISIDILHKLFGKHLNYYIESLIASVSYTVSSLSVVLAFSVIGIPLNAMKLGILYIVGLHLLFGAIAGIIAYTAANIIIKDKTLVSVIKHSNETSN